VASEARFRALTELSSDWYWEMDAEFPIHPHRVRRQGAERRPDAFGGTDRAAALGTGLAPVQPPTWDEHRAVLLARQPYRDLLMRSRGRDGSVHYVASSGDPVFDARGTFVGYRGVSKDVTDQVRAKESIERLARIDSLTELANATASTSRPVPNWRRRTRRAGAARCCSSTSTTSAC